MTNKLFFDKSDYKLHQKIILGTFVIGTIAFLLAHAWNEFFGSLVRAQIYWQTGTNEHGDTVKPDNSFILWYGVYAIATTIFALIIVYVMVRFDFLTEV